ncbi:hypothetical protein CLU79DRAFT_833099 [Phycomyces nitens]|nr:hypothetical protein CLU79DRAFT_833099 [Phycomyces nitens]
MDSRLEYVSRVTLIIGAILQCIVIFGTFNDKNLVESVYVKRYSNDENFVQFGLWQYCIGTKSRVTQCSSSLDTLLEHDMIIGIMPTFLTSDPTLGTSALCLYFIGFALSIISVFNTLLFDYYRRTFLAPLFSLSAFNISLSGLICGLVFAVRIEARARLQNINIHGSYGPTIWITVASVLCLFIGVIACLASSFANKDMLIVERNLETQVSLPVSPNNSANGGTARPPTQTTRNQRPPPSNLINRFKRAVAKSFGMYLDSDSEPSSPNVTVQPPVRTQPPAPAPARPSEYRPSSHERLINCLGGDCTGSSDSSSRERSSQARAEPRAVPVANNRPTNRTTTAANPIATTINNDSIMSYHTIDPLASDNPNTATTPVNSRQARS